MARINEVGSREHVDSVKACLFSLFALPIHPQIGYRCTAFFQGCCGTVIYSKIYQTFLKYAGASA